MTPLQKLVSTIIVLPLLFLASQTLHEYFHWVVANFTGGEGFVQYDIWRSYLVFTVIPHPLWPTEIAGGLLTGVVVGVFWFLARWTATWQDTWLEAGAACIALFQVAYAPSELLPWSWSDTVFPLAGFMLGVLLYKHKIIKWWESSNGS